MIDDSYYQRPEGLPETIAAGGIVARIDEGGRILIAAACEKDYVEHVLPKGHVEPGEEIETAARREIAEEVGIQDLTLLDKLDVLERMDYDKTEWKVTHYFLYVTCQRDVVPLEVDVHSEMVWVPLVPAPVFFWPEQRRLLVQHRERIETLVRSAVEASVDQAR